MLVLKDKVPVILLVNLNEQLVNGSRGVVVKLLKGSVEVKFADVNFPVVVKPHVFSRLVMYVIIAVHAASSCQNGC